LLHCFLDSAQAERPATTARLSLPAHLLAHPDTTARGNAHTSPGRQQEPGATQVGPGSQGRRVSRLPAGVRSGFEAVARRTAARLRDTRLVLVTGAREPARLHVAFKAEARFGEGAWLGRTPPLTRKRPRQTGHTPVGFALRSKSRLPTSGCSPVPVQLPSGTLTSKGYRRSSRLGLARSSRRRPRRRRIDSQTVRPIATSPAPSSTPSAEASSGSTCNP